jgi:DNA-binding CsgD family transcriptional regulator
LQRLDIEKIDRALDRSLEAAADPTLWPEILDRLVSATYSFGANLIPTSDITPDRVVFTDSIEAGFAEYFADGWHIKDWRYRGVPLIKKCGTARDQEYTALEDFRRLDFYRFQAKYGIGKSCLVGIPSPDDMVVLSLHRSLDADFYSDEEAAVFRRIGNRLTASAVVSHAISASKIKGMAEAFEATGVAAVFFDRFYRVTEVTSAAERIFGQEIDVNDGRLSSRIPGVTIAIRNRMHAAVCDKWLDPTEHIGPLLIPRSGARPLALLIQRLGGNLPDFFTHSVGVCLIEGIEPQPRQNAQYLRQCFGLTNAEGEIALFLLQGKSLREIAETKRISYETVRTHVRSILSKTDTKRQTELVALLNRLVVVR